jgi:peroxiredoxin
MPLLSRRSWILFSLMTLWIILSTLVIPLPENNTVETPKEGFPAPDFKLYSLVGRTYQLSQLRGKPIIINFWASWCPPCRQEMPALQAVYEKYTGESLQILAINVTNQDNERSVEQFISSSQLTFPILFDDYGEVSDRYRVSSLPTTYFIDQNGVIADIVIGGPMPEALILSKVENIMNGGQ